MILRVKKAISKPINPYMNLYFRPKLDGAFIQNLNFCHRNSYHNFSNFSIIIFVIEHQIKVPWFFFYQDVKPLNVEPHLPR